MLVRHIKIKQLTVATKKSNSNSDRLIMEYPLTICFDDKRFLAAICPQFVDFFVHGLIYNHTRSITGLHLQNTDPNTITVTRNPDRAHTLSIDASVPSGIQPDTLIHWMHLFKDGQSLYRQTGATESVGILLSDQSVLTIECLSMESATLKLVGALLKKDCHAYPVVFMSHALKNRSQALIDLLNPAIIMCQSAISAHFLDDCITHQRTLFGFCRKSTYNRYTNFHL